MCEVDPQTPRGSRTGAVKGGDGERAQGALVHRQSVEAKWEARARAHDDQFMGVRSVVSDVEQDVSGRYVIRRDGDVEIALGYAHDRCRAFCRSRARGTGARNECRQGDRQKPPRPRGQLPHRAVHRVAASKPLVGRPPSAADPTLGWGRGRVERRGLRHSAADDRLIESFPDSNRRPHALPSATDRCDEFPAPRGSLFVIPVASDPTMDSVRAGALESDWREMRCPNTGLEPARNGRWPGTSSPSSRPSRRSETRRSRESVAISPGSRSRRSTSSTPRTARRPSPSSSRGAHSYSPTTSCSAPTTRSVPAPAAPTWATGSTARSST